MLTIGGGILALAVLVAAYVWVKKPFQKTRTDLVTHKVGYQTLELTIVERGALESANNSDVYCRVKAKAQGTTVASTIKWVIDDGSHVKKDDLIVDLDDSGLIEQLKNEKIVVDTKESEKILAEENYKITLSQNESNIKAAEIMLELAKIDLQKYLEGDFPQKLKLVEGQISQAESDLEAQRDRSAWAQRMVKKGYLTTSQAQAEQSKLEACDLNLHQYQESKRVLTDPLFGEKKRQETFLKNAVATAERELTRIKGQALGEEVKAKTDRETKRSIYLQESARYKEIEDEIKKCKITAPQDGLVVYYVPEQARYGGGSQQSIVAQGEPVREGQKLMQIPDLTHMLVNTKVHEALVSRVHSGQPALVRVDSFPDRVLHGRIDSVATLSSQQDWLSADVKVYTTKVSIDEAVDNLKPGMSSEVTITIGDALEHVLTVPIQAVIGSAEMGKHRDLFVMTPNGPTQRSVVVGMSNETMAEIKEGIQEGEEVVLNPRSLVGDSVKTHQPGSQEKKGDGSGKPSGPGGPSERRGPGGPAAPGQGGPSDKNGSAPKVTGGPPIGPPMNNGANGSFKPEDRERMQKELVSRFKNLTPEQRKQQLEQIPEAGRGFVKQALQAQGIEIKE